MNGDHQKLIYFLAMTLIPAYLVRVPYQGIIQVTISLLIRVILQVSKCLIIRLFYIHPIGVLRIFVTRNIITKCGDRQTTSHASVPSAICNFLLPTFSYNCRMRRILALSAELRSCFLLLDKFLWPYLSSASAGHLALDLSTFNLLPFTMSKLYQTRKLAG